MLRPISHICDGLRLAVVIAARAMVGLLDGFELRCDGTQVSLPLSAQRVLAFVALQDQPVLRSYVAGKLWLDSTEDHATGSLRSALWRLRQPGYELIEAVDHKLRLSVGVAVDVWEAAAWARRLLAGGSVPVNDGIQRLPLLGELLPDWYDDWVLFERERLRELRAHALETLCERLTANGRFAQAMEAAQAAVKLEPLRESAHRTMMQVHLAEGNQAEAIRQYELYRRLLRDELELDPSPQMDELVFPLISQ